MVVRGDNASLATYTYNADGVRVKKVSGGVTTTYYVEDGVCYGESRSDGKSLQYLRDENGQVVGVRYQNGTSWDTTYYFVFNGQGDVIQVVSAEDGQVMANYTYDAWGKLLSVTNAAGGAVSDDAESIAAVNPFRYRGYYYDTETGLYYLQSRYYDADVGRFLNADSVITGTGESVQGYNLFAYCFNNPVNMDDQTGNWPSWSQVFTAVAVAAVAVAAVAIVVVTAGAAAPALAAAGGGIISAGTAATAASVAYAALATAGVAATASIVTSVVENTSYRGPTRDQSVYVMRDKTTNEVQYVGRTNNPMRRQSEHAKDLTKANLQPLEVKFSGLTKVEARAMEQVLISAYSLDNLSNARREIAVGNVGGFVGKIGNVISIFGGTVEDEFLNLMGR